MTPLGLKSTFDRDLRNFLDLPLRAIEQNLHEKGLETVPTPNRRFCLACTGQKNFDAAGERMSLNSLTCYIPGNEGRGPVVLERRNGMAGGNRWLGPRTRAGSTRASPSLRILRFLCYLLFKNPIQLPYHNPTGSNEAFSVFGRSS